MSTFLKLLPLELDDIKDTNFALPSDAVESGEKVVANDVSPYIKQLYTLWRSKMDSCKRATVEAMFGEKSDRVTLIAKVTESHTKADILGDLFWIAIKDECGMWDKEGIGIREGWRVVELAPAGI